MLNKLKIKIENRKKKAFYASDVGKSLLDLYFGFVAEPVTNPVAWYETMKWGAGSGMEDMLLRVLKDSDIVEGDYDQKEHGRIEIEREGIQIHGYMDAVTKEGIPIEIKSINNKNIFDIRNYESGNPRENYVGQLAVYMDALGVDLGYLFVSSIDGLHRWCLECKRIDKLKFKCGNVVVDLDKEYKRWSRLYKQNVEGKIVPDAFEYVYKLPLDEIDWRTVSKGDISKARNGNKVIGGKDSWRLTYSSWKDKIIGMQGVDIGYTREEMEFIKEKTQGYTTWD